MVIIDTNFNIQRIIDRVKNTNSVYDDGKTVGKLRSVIFGNPDNNSILSIKQKPALYVTTKNSIQKTSYGFGFIVKNNQPQVTVEYDLVLVAVSKVKSEKSQKQLHDLIKNILVIITDDPRFTNPANQGTDPIFTRSIVNGIEWDPKTKGQLVTSATITLLATIGKAFSINFPGIGEVILLSKPNNPEGIIFTENRIQKPINRVLSNNGDFGSLFVEYESTIELDAAFKAKFGIEENITLTTVGGDRVIHVKYIDINSTAQFDQIERSILHMEIIAT